MGLMKFVLAASFVFASGAASADNLFDALGGLFEGFGQPRQRKINVYATFNVPETTAVYIRVDKSVRRRDNPAGQTLTVYVLNNKGRLQPAETWDVSTGRERWEEPPGAEPYFSHTPTGRFHPTWLSFDHKSTTWDADMPRAIFFNGGVAIHCTTPSHYDALGTRDSGACVRLHCDNGARLYELVENTIEQYGKKSVVIDVVDPDEM